MNLDKQNSVVKVTIQYLDDDGKAIGDPKTVDYSTIAVAGKDLSDDVIKEAIEKNTTEPVVTRNTTTLSTDNGSSTDGDNDNDDDDESGAGNANPTDNTRSLINDENEFLANYGI